MEHTTNYNQPSAHGEALRDSSPEAFNHAERLEPTPGTVSLKPEKFQKSTQEKIAEFLSKLDSYDPGPPLAVDAEQARFLIHHLAQGVEREDVTTQMNRYIDIVKLCLQIKDKDLYRDYTEKLQALTARAESEAPSVEESTERINKLIDNSLN